jgi:hypothetical protein
VTATSDNFLARLRPEEFPEANQWLVSIVPAGLAVNLIRGDK